MLHPSLARRRRTMVNAWDEAFFSFSFLIHSKPRQKLRLKFDHWKVRRSVWCGLMSVKLIPCGTEMPIKEVCVASWHVTNCPSLEIERKMLFPQFLDLSTSPLGYLTHPEAPCLLSKHTNLTSRELEAWGVFAKLARQHAFGTANGAPWLLHAVFRETDSTSLDSHWSWPAVLGKRCG